MVLAVSCLILFFFFAFRGESVGVDTKYYCYVFRQFADIPLKSVFHAATYGSDAHTWKFDFEPGFRLINKLLSYISVNGQAITIATGILIFVPLFCFVLSASPNVWLSIWLYLTLGIFQTEMNVSRNAIAIFLCYCALPLIRRNRFILYTLVVVLASTIHQTALLFLPVFFLVRCVPLNRRRMITILAASLFLGLNFNVFSPAFQDIVPSRYVKYFTAENDKLIAVAVGIFSTFLLCVSTGMLTRDEREHLIVDEPVDSWMLLLYVCFFAVGIGFASGSRAAALFGPYLIVLIPRILDRITDEKRKRAAVIAVAAICFAQYVCRMEINNIGGSMPYCFFWQN